ncbi:MAG: polysaccharide biosynthesis/export family protein [Planctomycetes bacterium]|nr:polysaccharide biosynthesis/export family protein [Planctomycetota bacterium]
MVGKCRRIGVAALLAGYCMATFAGCMVIEGTFPPPSSTGTTSTPWNTGSLSTGALKPGPVPDRLPRDIQPTASLPAEPQPVESKDAVKAIQPAQLQQTASGPKAGSPATLPASISAANMQVSDGQPGARLPNAGQLPPTDAGCAAGGAPNLGAATGMPLPTEKSMVSHPLYTVAPQDIITIDAIRLVPRPPYKVEPLEILFINVTDTLPNQPISGAFVVSPEGTVSLGFNYGSVRVSGMTLDQIQNAVRTHLANILRNAQVTIALAQFRGFQQIRGEHLVRQDGTISLGTYGSVYVAGMSLEQTKCAIENHLAAYLLNPQVAVDVFAYNSKVYYVIIDGGGFGQQVFRLPITGNETVLDAISQVQGLAPVSSKHRIWLARPSPVHANCNQVLPVDWNAITQGGSTPTNYQIFPGDRVYVSANRLIQFDNYLSQLLAPVERVLGVTLLGTQTFQSFRNNGNNNAFIVP